jgi:hypothetical protein
VVEEINGVDAGVTSAGRSCRRRTAGTAAAPAGAAGNGRRGRAGKVQGRETGTARSLGIATAYERRRISRDKVRKGKNVARVDGFWHGSAVRDSLRAPHI